MQPQTGLFGGAVILPNSPGGGAMTRRRPALSVPAATRIFTHRQLEGTPAEAGKEVPKLDIPYDEILPKLPHTLAELTLELALHAVLPSNGSQYWHDGANCGHVWVGKVHPWIAHYSKRRGAAGETAEVS
jgi:hypothetical protein